MEYINLFILIISLNLMIYFGFKARKSQGKSHLVWVVSRYGLGDFYSLILGWFVSLFWITLCSISFVSFIVFGLFVFNDWK